MVKTLLSAALTCMKSVFLIKFGWFEWTQHVGEPDTTQYCILNDLKTCLLLLYCSFLLFIGRHIHWSMCSKQILLNNKLSKTETHSLQSRKCVLSWKEEDCCRVVVYYGWLTFPLSPHSICRFSGLCSTSLGEQRSETLLLLHTWYDLVNNTHTYTHTTSHVLQKHYTCLRPL